MNEDRENYERMVRLIDEYIERHPIRWKLRGILLDIQFVVEDIFLFLVAPLSCAAIGGLIASSLLWFLSR